MLKLDNIRRSKPTNSAKNAWPLARGQKPRLAGLMGRYVRNAEGVVVRLSATPEDK